MKLYQDVFKRKEIKYVLGAQQYEAVRQGLQGRMAPDKYGLSSITSIYYDTYNHDVIEHSMSKPVYKEKLRVRYYGEALQSNSQVFIELKKKYKGIVYKRRLACSYRAAMEYLAVGDYKAACAAYPLENEHAAAASLSARSLQIAREIDAFKDAHDPMGPAMAIRVKRLALAASAEDVEAASPSLRVTFDHEAGYCDLMGAASPEDLRIKPLMPQGQVIMEVKCAGAMPLWLARLLDAADARPSSCSKYGKAYLLCCA